MNSLTCESPNCISSAPEFDQLVAHIRCRLGGRVRDLQVLGRDNGLVLKGHIHTYYAKQLAQHAVMEVTLLRIVANEIEVSSARRRGQPIAELEGRKKEDDADSRSVEDEGVLLVSEEGSRILALPIRNSP